MRRRWLTTAAGRRSSRHRRARRHGDWRSRSLSAAGPRAVLERVEVGDKAHIGLDRCLPCRRSDGGHHGEAFLAQEAVLVGAAAIWRPRTRSGTVAAGITLPSLQPRGGLVDSAAAPAVRRCRRRHRALVRSAAVTRRAEPGLLRRCCMRGWWAVKAADDEDARFKRGLGRSMASWRVGSSRRGRDGALARPGALVQLRRPQTLGAWKVGAPLAADAVRPEMAAKGSEPQLVAAGQHRPGSAAW